MFFRLAFLLFVSPAFAADFFVATNGRDTNAGTQAAPWRTIQKAANSLAPGDTAFVRAGIYRERVVVRVSGEAGQLVTLRNFADEKVIIDGGQIVPAIGALSGLVHLADVHHVVIRGFEIRNFHATRGNRAPAGVVITGESNHLEIRDNNIHDIRYNSARGNAFGIAVYGTSAAHPISGVIIDGNNVHHLKLGNSESLVINGNVTDFAVTNNRVHDNNNIGIDFIGYEGTCPDVAQDRARDGVCRGNTVWNIASRGNPAYAGESSAGGIYVDGGTRVVIERNVVFNCDLGIELASEHAERTTSEIAVRENIVYRNHVVGLSIGGYDARRGETTDCTITNNTFYRNDTRRTGTGELALQHFVYRCTVRGNMFVAGPQSLLVSNAPRTNEGNVFDYNLYFAPAGEAASEWQWRGSARTGFSDWQTFAGQDAHSLFAAPQFVDEAARNFLLSPGSPAIDAGDPDFAPVVGETDFDGEPRVKGGRVDLGADEF